MLIDTVFLLVSELPFFRSYFDRHWPSLGEDSGFLSLAFAMLILGIGALGDLNTPATSQEELGLTFWRIVISAGILALVVSVINVAAVSLFALFSYIFVLANAHTELRLCRPRYRRQRTPRPRLRSRRAAESCLSHRQPAFIPAQLQA